MALPQFRAYPSGRERWNFDAFTRVFPPEFSDFPVAANLSSSMGAPVIADPWQ